MTKYILALLVLLGAAIAPAGTPTSQTACSETSPSETPCTATENVTCSCEPVVAPVSLNGLFTHYWQLADTSDAIGSATLTNNGGVTFTAGKIGDAANTSTTGPKYLSNAAIAVTGPSLCVSMWFKVQSNASTQVVFSLGPNASAGSFTLQFNGNILNGTMLFYTDAGHILTTDVGYTDNSYHHVVAWHNASTGINTVVIDRNTTKSLGSTSDVTTGNKAFALGALTTGGAPANAQLDAVGIIMNGVPSSGVLDALWNSGNGVEPPF